jgi:hypothetical protein
MRNCIVAALALALVAGVAQNGSAAEPGKKLSQGALANLGLGGARTMSDAEGDEVRGMSIAIVMGVGAASIVFTNEEGNAISSVVETTAYGGVDTDGRRRLRAFGNNAGGVEVRAGAQERLVVGAYFSGQSLARVGRRFNIPSP